ncbi:hypothetical protein B0T25DRAFT_527826 [Lasiosphaeria hispida]|uniref:Secreted protein n=1 Tax=Lasiosphaeria hispida TaxID=260671 RepID=A0AAJ0MK81_9PEZI|nr:hypothetical protein B0T25DRAFT_527826 [Lasiosphaeria hispida]
MRLSALLSAHLSLVLLGPWDGNGKWWMGVQAQPKLLLQLAPRQAELSSSQKWTGAVLRSLDPCCTSCFVESLTLLRAR